MAAYLHRDLLVDKLMRQVEEDCARHLPVEQRGQRIAELERERDELWRIEAALIDSDPEAVCSPSMPPWIVLGVNVVEQETRLAS